MRARERERMKKDKEESCSSSEEAVVVITSNYSNLHPCSLLQCLFRACFGCLGSLDDTTDKVHHHLSLSLSLSLSLTHTHTHTHSNLMSSACLFPSCSSKSEMDQELRLLQTEEDLQGPDQIQGQMARSMLYNPRIFLFIFPPFFVLSRFIENLFIFITRLTLHPSLCCRACSELAFAAWAG